MSRAPSFAISPWTTTAWMRARRQTTEWMVRGVLDTMDALGPGAGGPGLRMSPNVRYANRAHGAHLEVLRLDDDVQRPVLVYFHGGGFRILSRRTHRALTRQWARAGYVVFSVDYRLAPEYAYPAAHEDACEAVRWVHAHAHRWGGDAATLVLSGESAGGNLALAATIACSTRRPEPWAAALFDAGIRPAAAVLACGLLEVSRPNRFENDDLPGALATPVMREVARTYGGTEALAYDVTRALLDPLVFLERSGSFERPLPPMFTFAGTLDPLQDDALRLQTALAAHRTRCDVRLYPGGGHSFHAFRITGRAHAAWTDQITWLAQTLAERARKPSAMRPSSDDRTVSAYA